MEKEKAITYCFYWNFKKWGCRANPVKRKGFRGFSEGVRREVRREGSSDSNSNSNGNSLP
jgi:hypothetical protein